MMIDLGRISKKQSEIKQIPDIVDQYPWDLFGGKIWLKQQAMAKKT